MLADVLRRGIGKQQIGVYVNNIVKQAGTGNEDYALPADVVVAMNAAPFVIILEAENYQAQTSGTWSTSIFATQGLIAKDVDDVITEHSVCSCSSDNVGTTATYRRIAAKAFTQVNTAGALLVEGTFVGLFGNAMRFNWATNSGTASKINYMIITGLEDAKSIAWATPATPGEATISSVGFKSDLVIHGAVVGFTGAPPATGGTAGMGLGFMNKFGQQACNAWGSDGGQSEANTGSRQRTDSAISMVSFSGLSQTTRFRAKFVSMTSTGFKMNFIEAVAAEYQISLCLKGISSKIGAFTHPTTATTKTVTSRHGFDPKGIIFSSIRNLPVTSPVAHALWHCGFSDLTNSRVVALDDVDTFDPTEANSVWMNDAVIADGPVGPGPTTTLKANLVSATDDDFLMSFSIAHGNEMEEIYCVLGDADQDVFPSAIDSSAGLTTQELTAYSNQKKLTQIPSGRMLAIMNENHAGASARYTYIKYSDDGVEWLPLGSSSGEIGGAVNSSIMAYVDGGGNVRVALVWKQSGTLGSRVDGKTYLMIGTLSGNTITWGTAFEMAVTAANVNYPDLVAFAESTVHASNGGVVYVVTSHNEAPNGYTARVRFDITGTTITQNGAALVLGTATANSGTHTMPSITFDPVSKRLFVTWINAGLGAGKGIRFITASYSAGVWTWAAEVAVDTTASNDGGQTWYMTKMLWDAGRFLAVIAIWAYTGSAYRLAIYDSSDFTAFTARITNDTLSGESRLGSSGVAIDPATGDIYYFGFGNNYSGAYRKITRTGASLSLGSRVELDHHGLNFNALTLVNGDIGFVYTKGAATPYDVKYDRIAL